ncbi:MAG: glycerophosphodiester phosphodiesterase family protein [Candidatus Saccharimonadales bacterium]
MSKEKPASEYPFYDIPGPIAIVHRGGDAAGADKENSMAAFESANRAGIIYAETDTVATKDGVPLAFHGSRKEKIAKKTGLPLRDAIQAMTYKEVVEKVRVGGEPMPLLEELLVTFPNMRFFIDPKTPEAVEPTAKIIERLHAQDRVSIGAFSYKRTGQTAELIGGQKDVCTSLAALGSVAMLGLGNRATAPFVKPYFTRTEATSLQVPDVAVSSNMIERAHDLGIHVIVWPSSWKNPAAVSHENDTSEYMKRVMEQGVHGLMSDRTALMKDIILAHDPQNQSIRRDN